MGSVPHLYTTGDNDPELWPEQYYRHYLYCDACASFDLHPWMAPENLEAVETRRRWLATGAIFSLPLVVVPAWLMLGLFPSLSFWVMLPASIAWTLILWGFIWKTLWGSDEPIAQRWAFLKKALLVLLAVGLAESIAYRYDVEPMAVLAVGVLLIAGLLAERARLGSKIRYLGLRCRQCGATYASGSSLFTDLDSNPRELTLEQVPRPLGSSPFERGRDVGPAAEKTPPSRQPP